MQFLLVEKGKSPITKHEPNYVRYDSAQCTYFVLEKGRVVH